MKIFTAIAKVANNIATGAKNLAEKFEKDTLEKRLANVEASISRNTELLSIKKAELDKETANFDEVKELCTLKMRAAEAGVKEAGQAFNKQKEIVLNLNIQKKEIANKLAGANHA